MVLVAAALFFLGVMTIATRRMGALALILVVILASVLESFFGVLVYVLHGAARAYGALFNPNHHAAMVVMGIPMLIAGIWALKVSHPRFRHGALGGENPLILLVAVLLMMVMSWLTALSRGSLLAGILVMGGWLAYEMRAAAREGGTEFSRHEKMRFGVAASAAVVLLVLMGLATVLDSYARRYTSAVVLGDLNRLDKARATITGLLEAPLTGLGPAGAEQALNRFSRISTERIPIHTHNDWVEWLAELGIPAAIVAGMLLWKFAAAFLREWRRREESSSRRGIIGRAAAAGALIAFLHAAADFHLRVPLVAFQFFSLVAVALGPGTRRMIPQRGQSFPRSSVGMEKFLE